jgi:hypothetical protein
MEKQMVDNIIKQTIKRHIEVMGNAVVIVALGSHRDSFTKFEKCLELSTFGREIKFDKVLIEDDNSFILLLSYDIKETIFFIVDDVLPEVIRIHNKLKIIKDKGAIIVCAFVRNLFFERPKGAAGITYEGIFTRSANFIADLPGDYLEFGVFDGRTMSLAYHCMKNRNDMRFFGFDSFSGIIGKTDQEDTNYNDGNYYSNIETFIHNMKVTDVEMQNVYPCKCNYLDENQMLMLKKSNKITKAAVIHIDCDVYLAAKAALCFCTDLVQQGSILLFDEFHANHASNAVGERRALREWLDENPKIKVERWHDYAAVARAFIVHVE